MSASAPPPPPPGGNNGPPPRQVGPVFPPGANDGGDGRTMETATWVVGSNKDKPFYIVEQGSSFIRCNLQNAWELQSYGYTIRNPNNGKKVTFKYNGPGRPQFEAFTMQYWEIQQEEQAAVARHDRLTGEEDLAEGAEEHDYAGDTVFDEAPKTPSRGPRGQGLSSPSSGGGRGEPSTPRGPAPSSQPGSGRSSGGSGRRGAANLFGILKSPKSPSTGKGKGPAGSSGTA